MSEISIKPAKIVGTGPGQVVYLKNPEAHLLDPTRNGYRIIDVSTSGDKIIVRRDDEIVEREFYPEDLTNEKPRKKFKVGDTVSTTEDYTELPANAVVRKTGPNTLLYRAHEKKADNVWEMAGTDTTYDNEEMSAVTRTILWLPENNDE